MFFKTTAKIANQEVAAVVQFVIGENRLDLQPDDAITVVDPKNKWPEIEANATGIAYLRPEREDDPSTTGEDESRDERWEIEQCTLPVNYMLVRPKQCFTASDETFTAEFKTSNTLEILPDGQEDAWKLSTYPNVDVPPEATPVDDGEGGTDTKYEITITNEGWDFAGSTDTGEISEIRVIRKPFTNASVPDGDDVPNAFALIGTAIWVVEEVLPKDRHARWVCGDVVAEMGATTGTFSNLVFTEGADPEVCGSVTIEFCVPPSYNVNGKFEARYNPEADKYHVVQYEEDPIDCGSDLGEAEE